MKLKVYIRDCPDKSKVVVFHDVLSRAMQIQRILGAEYKGDRYLWDLLEEAIDIPSTQVFPKDLPARTVHSLLNLVGGKLRKRLKTAGAIYANWAISNGDNDGGMVYYGLAQRFGGGARRLPKSFVKWGRNPRKDSSRRRPPRWMRGIEGCFVCRKYHHDNQHHDR